MDNLMYQMAGRSRNITITIMDLLRCKEVVGSPEAVTKMVLLHHTITPTTMAAGDTAKPIFCRVRKVLARTAHSYNYNYNNGGW